MDSQPTKHIFTRELKWDYRQPAIYLITLTVTGRQPLLGTLTGEGDEARVIPTSLGWKVFELIGDIPNHHQEVKILQRMIMPDHVHFILHVTQPMPQPLGLCIRGLKWACNAAWRKEREKNLSLPPERLSGEVTSQQGKSLLPLFERDFYPSRLASKGQLQSMFAYIQDNPRRLAVKRANRGFFQIERGITLESIAVDMIGNKALLKEPMIAVHVHQVWTPTEVAQYQSQCIEAALRGVVMISPFISTAERQVRDRVLQQGGRVIVIRQEGFGELYKPEPMYFDACAEGRVLLVAVGEYHQHREQVSRAQCVAMNDLAERLASHSISL